MAVWADRDENAPEGPFDGCLVIMNIGVENFASFDKGYIERVLNAAADARASGWAILWVFNGELGVMRLPEEWEFMDGHDYIRPMSVVCGRRDSNFPTLPDARKAEFKAMADAVFSHKSFRFLGKTMTLMGSCSIDGTPVLLPPTEVL